MRPVTTESELAAFVAVQTNAYSFGMPPGEVAAVFSRPQLMLDVPQLLTVVAYRDGQPVAGAQTLLSHGIAGVYWVGTVDTARRRGIGEVVTRAVTMAAFDMGATANSLQASSEGESAYRRVGYEPAFRYRRYVRLRPLASKRRWKGWLGG